jgi:hypothetical protein
MKTLDYQIDLRAASRGYDRQKCWTQARAGAIPPAAPGENPTMVLTMQKIRLTGSDDYEPIHSLYSTDLGQTWSVPVEQAAFARQPVTGLGNDTIERTVCDFTPKWHSATGKLLGTGHSVYYSGDHLMKDRPRETPYSVYDPATHEWSVWHTLEMPDPEKFYNAGAGCTQRVDLPNGEILLPVYFKPRGSTRSSSIIVRCSFDGEKLEYIEHGTELSVDVARGLGEPSLTYYQDRYFLALRNDEHNYFAVGDDGLHFSEPRRWQFDDGEELGSYNTQQHWVTHSGGLFLVYTRRGLDNDHVFRHRAPLVMAQVDTDNMRVLRETERLVIPERGARLGNFGVTEVSEYESWVVEAEWMQNSGEWGRVMKEKVQEMGCVIEGEWPYMCRECECFGSDNTVWTSRLLWSRPNATQSTQTTLAST